MKSYLKNLTLFCNQGKKVQKLFLRTIAKASTHHQLGAASRTKIKKNKRGVQEMFEDSLVQYYLEHMEKDHRR